MHSSVRVKTGLQHRFLGSWVIPDDGAKYTTHATRIVGHEKNAEKTINTFSTKKDELRKENHPTSRVS